MLSSVRFLKWDQNHYEHQCHQIIHLTNPESMLSSHDVARGEPSYFNFHYLAGPHRNLISFQRFTNIINTSDFKTPTQAPQPT